MGRGGGDCLGLQCYLFIMAAREIWPASWTLSLGCGVHGASWASHVGGREESSLNLACFSNMGAEGDLSQFSDFPGLLFEISNYGRKIQVFSERKKKCGLHTTHDLWSPVKPCCLKHVYKVSC